MTRAEQIRGMDDSTMADQICDMMPGEDCHTCRFKERKTGRCTLLEYLEEEVDDDKR